MTDTEFAGARPDVDILDDIQHWLYTYPPLSHDRTHIQVTVTQGMVYVSGNIKSPITRKYLTDHIGEVSGVRGLNSDQLYDDDTIRLAMGNLMPVGLIANVEYGTVILSGKLPGDAELEPLVAQITTINGVHRVVTVG